MDDEGLWSATALSAALRARTVSSRELLDLFARRQARLDPAINAVVTLDLERAGEEAHRADEAAANGRLLGPLHGLPVTVKDALETAGMRSTGGARELATHVPEADAVAVARLRAAGAVVFGKTNVPRWSSDIQTYNDLFGTTNNPWDPARTPGGSSGGAAAAVAAGLTSFEVGTDIGGSLRVPAGFCGICAHKPSYGIVPQAGYLGRPGGRDDELDINVVGPLARHPEDLDLLLSVLAGPVAAEAVGWRLALPPPRHDDLRHYRVGVWLDDPAAPVSRGVVAALGAAAEALAAAGARVVPAHPEIDVAATQSLFQALVAAAVSPGLPPQVAATAGGTHVGWLAHDRARAALRERWRLWFGDHDALLCPVTPMPAFPHDHDGTLGDRLVSIDGHPRTHREALAWVGMVGVSYLPATVVPVGLVEGLPVGVQVVGPYLEDRTALFLGHRLAELLGAFRPPPIALAGAGAGPAPGDTP